jgi:hypothetical protein
MRSIGPDRFFWGSRCSPDRWYLLLGFSPAPLEIAAPGIAVGDCGDSAIIDRGDSAIFANQDAIWPARPETASRAARTSIEHLPHPLKSSLRVTVTVHLSLTGM